MTIPKDEAFNAEAYMRAIHALESGAPMQILDPDEGPEVYRVDIGSAPITMSFTLSLLEWHMLIGMVSGCSDHLRVGQKFVNFFQQGMVEWAKEAGEEVVATDS